MSTLEINSQVNAKLDAVRSTLVRTLAGNHGACLTCSFQAEDVLLAKLAIELDANLPILFLDTGYHFKETYAYRDRIAQEWKLNLVNLLPAKTVAQQEAEHGLLYQSAPDQCCKLRKVEPLFTLPGGKQVLKLAPLAEWTTRDVWYACAQLGIPLLPLYELGYSSIGCEPCTTLPLDPNDPRSGRWAGRKVECGIHIEAAPAK